jgi:cell wall-associated NlpC family hydrolase
VSADFGELFNATRSALDDILGSERRQRSQEPRSAYAAYFDPAGGPFAGAALYAPAPEQGQPGSFGGPFAAQALYGRGDLGQGGYGIQADPLSSNWFQQANQRVPKPQEPKTGLSGTAVEAGDWSGPATADDNKTLTPEQVDTFIRETNPNSPLIGKGAYILQRANAHQVSAPELLALFWKESSLGSTAGPTFNIAGVGGAGNFNAYGSWEQAIDGAAANLATDLYRGKSIQDHIGFWYAGPERYKRWGVKATDAGDGSAPSPNGTVEDYLNKFVGPTYRALGVPYNQGAAGSRRAGGAVPPSEVASRAQTWVGKVGYSSGGIRATGNIADGADCSSFAGWLIGADPRDWNAQTLYDASAKLQPGQLQPGDLVFFDIANAGDPTARPVGHVAVWLGNGKIAQSTTLNGTNGVQIISLPNDSYLVQHIYGYGRYRARAGGNR